MDIKRLIKGSTDGGRQSYGSWRDFALRVLGYFIDKSVADRFVKSPEKQRNQEGDAPTGLPCFSACSCLEKLCFNCNWAWRVQLLLLLLEQTRKRRKRKGIRTKKKKKFVWNHELVLPLKSVRRREVSVRQQRNILNLQTWKKKRSVC